MKDLQEEYKYKEKLALKQQLPSLDKLVKICCPSCNAAVPSVNINIGKEIAKCDACDGVFSFSDNHQLSQRSNRPQVLQPEGVEIFHFQNELDISFKQPTDILSIILLCSFAPLAIMFLLGSLKKIALLFPAILSLLAVAFLLIRFIASLRNKVYIGIDDKHLSVVKRPFKFFFGKDQYYNIEEFDQIYVKKIPHPGGTGKEVYIIKAILNTPKGQKHIKLTPIIDSKSKAKFIEQEIEQHLEIIDRPVPEED